jgi:hypothetical protein
MFRSAGGGVNRFAGACPRTGGALRIAASLGDRLSPTSGGAGVMSKGLERRKETKKKPQKTKEEKRAEKRAKQAERGR